MPGLNDASKPARDHFGAVGGKRHGASVTTDLMPRIGHTTSNYVRTPLNDGLLMREAARNSSCSSCIRRVSR